MWIRKQKLPLIYYISIRNDYIIYIYVHIHTIFNFSLSIFPYLQVFFKIFLFCPGLSINRISWTIILWCKMRLYVFFCFSILAWRISSIYKGRQNSIINSHVPITLLPQLSTHGYTYFIFTLIFFPSSHTTLKQIPDLSFRS